MLAQLVGTVVLSFLARRVDKKYAAAGLCAVTGLCFLTFYFLPKDRFDLLLTSMRSDSSAWDQPRR